MTQRLPDSAVWKIRNKDQVPSCSQSEQFCIEPKKYCAYNQTRGHLLAADLDGADFSVATFVGRIPALTENSGAGLWLVPFRVIPVVAEESPLDLIYLDANFIVIDVVESFPIFSISKESPPAASVLVLPSQTIRWTHTRQGDQLLLCAANEFNRLLLRLRNSAGNAKTARIDDSEKAPEIYGGSSSQGEVDNCSRKAGLNSYAPSGVPRSSFELRRDAVNDPTRETLKTTKNWLQRLWSPDPPEPRKAQRESFPGLSARFWTGGTSVEHEVRDISLTGLYVVTDERWYKGTQVRMTLTDSLGSTEKNSISANTTVVRWGNDGVGLTFVMENRKELRRGNSPVFSGVVKEDFIRFLELERSGQRNRETSNAHLTVPLLSNHDATNNRATDPIFDDLFIGPTDKTLLIGSLKDLPRPVGDASPSHLMNVSDTSQLPLHGAMMPTPSRRRPRILLIDDDYLDIVFLSDILEKDYEVIFASDGVAALESAGRRLPDLILLDVMMPGIDGFEVCRRLKADGRTKDIPVIFITGLSEATAEAKGLNIGAVDFISKPFHPVQLRAGVNLHLGGRRHGKPRSN